MLIPAEDLAMMLEVMAGFDARDATGADAAQRRAEIASLCSGYWHLRVIAETRLRGDRR